MKICINYLAKHMMIQILVAHMLMSCICLMNLLIFDKFLICSYLNIIFDASFMMQLKVYTPNSKWDLPIPDRGVVLF